MPVANLKVRVLGTEQARRELSGSQKRLFGEAERRVREAGEVLIGAAQKEFKGSRTRALYKIKGGRRVARKPPRAVSSPPSKLGIFEGTYRKSIGQELEAQRRGRSGRFIVSTSVGPSVRPYPAAHEFGLGNMPKRQVLTPAVKKTEREIFKIIGRTFKVVNI